MKAVISVVWALVACSGEPFRLADDPPSLGGSAPASSLGGSASPASAGNKSQGGTGSAGAPASSSDPSTAGNGNKSGGGGAGGAGGAPELEPGGGAGGAPELELAPCSRAGWRLEAFATASGKAAALALDGDPATAWESGEPRQPGQWVTLELGAPLELGRLELETKPGDGVPVVALELDGAGVDVDAVVNGSTLLVLTFSPRRVSRARLELVNGSAHWWTIVELRGDCR